MSHGPSHDTTVEPNLTPLLDLVMQLLMFFMICGNYAAEQSNEPVNLAFSETAKQLGDEAQTAPGPEEDFLFLTVKPYHPDTNAGDLANHLAPESQATVLEKYKDGDAYVLIVGHDAMRAEPDGELLVWLGQQHSDLERKSKDGQVHTSVVIRPDGDLDYAVVYRILKFCKDKGFTNLKVRALIGKGVSK
jgi:biopolymer transport protein ExbD